MLCVCVNTVQAEKYDYGLSFNAQKSPAINRTSMQLDGGRSFTLQKNLEITFDMYIRANEPEFGGILNLVLNGKQDMHFMIASDETSNICLALIYKDVIKLLRVPIVKEKWLPVSVTLNRGNNTVSVSYGKHRTMINVPLKNCGSVSMSFGCVEGLVQEVAPMIVRNVSVRQDGRQTRFWRLAQHNGNICYDELAHAEAVTSSPSWQLDKHVQWRLVYSANIQKNVDVAFNPDGARFYLVYDDAVEEYDDRGFMRKRYHVSDGYAAPKYFPHCFYDVVKKKIAVYSIRTRNVSYFSFETGRWSNENRTFLDATNYNHAIALNPADSSYYFFGGYGLYSYRNDLYRLAPGTSKLQRVSYSPMIPPRFAAAMAIVGNKLYILGGRGNKVGRQAVESYFYYDLWEIDLRTHKARQLWDGKESLKTVGLMLTSSMVYNKKDGCLYVVNMEDNGGLLLKISIDKPWYKAVSRHIGNVEQYQDFDYDMFWSPKNRKMYLVVDKMMVDKSHHLSIYSINTPLLNEVEISQNFQEASSGKWWIYVVAAVIIVGFGAVIFVCVRRRNLHKVVVAPAVETVPNSDTVTVDTAGTGSIRKNDTELVGGRHYFDRSRSSISILGGFNVRDRNGNDITSLFTRKIKDMLVLLILYTERDSVGLSVKKLTDILWYDKESNLARNNRNVSTSKLRLLLEKVGNVEISNENGYMRIVWGDGVFCDYHALRNCLDEFYNGGSTDGVLVEKIKELMLYGPLLPEMSVNWLDEFKAKNSDTSIDILRKILALEKEKGDMNAQLLMADIMFLHDPLSEEALAVKCSILFRQGKKSIAKNVYDSFCKEYKDTLADDFDIPFSELEKY